MTHTQSPNERDRLVLLKRELNHYRANQKNLIPPAQGLFMAAQSQLQKYLGSRERRIAFYRWAFDTPEINSSNDLLAWQKLALVLWAKPAKLGPDWPWTYERQFKVDCSLLAAEVQHD